MRDEWELVASYIRSRWQYSDQPDHLPAPTSGDTAEADDFREIKRTMAEEDQIDPPRPGRSAAEMDEHRFHRNWVLGLLLGFEGRALSPRPEDLDLLIDMASESQLADGSYYPSRVPWVTARVLLGLTANSANSRAIALINESARWLRTPEPDGPLSYGVWRARTGSWNTDLQMTAMALLALGRAGFAPSDPAVRAGMTYLRQGRSEWYRPGKEIDCAQAVEAALVLGGSWRDYDAELRSLLTWAQDSKSWADSRTLASVTRDESSKVPAVTASLIAIIWETVRAELPTLFQGMSDIDVGINIQESAPAGSGALIREQLSEILYTARERTRDRRALAESGTASREVTDALEHWERCLAIAASLGDRAATMSDAGIRSKDFLDDVEALGKAVFGDGWRLRLDLPGDQ
jgi:hypothetical protein